MKKLLICLVAACFVLGVVSCVDDSDDGDSEWKIEDQKGDSDPGDEDPDDDDPDREDPDDDDPKDSEPTDEDTGGDDDGNGGSVEDADGLVTVSGTVIVAMACGRFRNTGKDVDGIKIKLDWTLMQDYY